jgi:hypothetical protein
MAFLVDTGTWVYKLPNYCIICLTMALADEGIVFNLAVFNIENV